MIRHILTAILIAASVFGLGATVYSPEDIPNVQLTDSTQYVSNPDGILTASAVGAINDVMRRIRHTTTAEGVVVVVDDIDGDDPDTFATDLFELWGLGKEDKDNGFLVLIVKNLHRATIRPGYGIEGVLPDVTCATILRDRGVPEFREDNYSAGATAIAAAIGQVLMQPENAEYIRSGQADANSRGNNEDDDFFAVYFMIAGCVGAVMLIMFLVDVFATRGKPLQQRYSSLDKLKPVYLILTFLGLGVPLVATIPLLLTMQYWRNRPRRCPSCGTRMKKLDEVTDNLYLNPGQNIEEELGSVDYDVWLCPKCGERDIEPYVNNSSTFKTCPRCGVRAYSLRTRRIIRPATTRAEGLGVNNFYCRACGYDHDENFRIPRKADDSALLAGAVLGAAASSRGGGGGFGGGFGGGGFGGGSTGGGGSTVGW